MYQQRKSGPINNSYRRNNNKPTIFQPENQSQPRFILKNPSHFPLRPQSAMEEECANQSYLELYQQQKQRQNSPDDPRMYQPRNSSYSVNEGDYSHVSLKLQQILQKQIQHSQGYKPTKAKTQQTSNSSFENHNSYHMNKSVDIVPEPSKNTAMKSNYQVNKLQLISNDIVTPNNQITFQGDDELILLRAENKKLISSIKKLNLDFQQQKSQIQTLQQQNQKLRTELSEQGNEFNRMIEVLQQEKADILKQISKPRTSEIPRQKSENCRPSLLTRMHEYCKEEQVLPTKTHQEIDVLKNRILARKSTQRSSRENISKVGHYEDILNEMDSSARLDLQSIRGSFQEDDKENMAHFGNR